MKVVTAGLKFTDIDAYAGTIAYAELLRLQGHKAIAFSSAAINESVTPTIRSWPVEYSTEYMPAPDDTFVLIDVSEPDFIEKHVDLDRVEEVIDHHAGFEVFWQERIGDKADIEFIGAACTQVYEKWVQVGRFNEMLETSARLLISGILDNTLNFKAAITTERDHAAYRQLLTIANLPNDWTAQYFTECEALIMNDIGEALINDTKGMQFRSANVPPLAFGQLALWDAAQAVSNHKVDIKTAMDSVNEHWFVNVISIAEGKSYFLSTSPAVQEWASRLLGITFTDGLGIADRLWLRKEVIKQDMAG